MTQANRDVFENTRQDGGAYLKNADKESLHEELTDGRGRIRHVDGAATEQNT